MSALLELSAVRYAVGGKALVDDASLRLRAGELTVILGPNGAGKSTLLRLACGELKPERGEVLWEGRPLASWTALELASARAVLPQSSVLAFPFTVAEVARIGLDVVGRALPPLQRQQHVAEGLRRADVAHLAGRNYQTLSGGERQRVHFARVLAQLAAGRSATGRQALFLDEPTSALDIRHQLLLMGEAKRMAGQGLCVVAVLHDLNLAASMADRIVVMKGGRIVANGTPQEALTTAILEEVFEVEVELIAGRGGPAFSFSLPDERRTDAASA